MSCDQKFERKEIGELAANLLSLDYKEIGVSDRG